MRKFEHKEAKTFEEASELIKVSKSGTSIAGGTDLVGLMKSAILEKTPDVVVDLKTIGAKETTVNEDGSIVLGAMNTLSEISDDESVPTGLRKAANSVATPIIRNAATIGGNICQDVRCWYYRYPHNQGGRLDCARKDGDLCYAVLGDNRYHSIFGGMKTARTKCSNECPAGTDISGYMEKIRQGDWDGAAKIILRANPMPMLTSRVCPHTCQTKCNQSNHGDSVNIHAVERTLGDYILKNKSTYFPAPSSESGKSVGIVGSGPAGLAAAFYLRKMGHAVTIFEKMPEAGGVLMYGIPEYRLPKALMREYNSAIEGMGVVFKFNTTVGEDISFEEVEETFDTVFIDTGAWKQPILGIDGENLTQFGLNFLVEVKQWMTSKIDEEVLVCGGGNVAMDVALTAKRLGAKKVTLVCLEQREQMPASKEEVDRALEEGVIILNGLGLNKVRYEGDKVLGLETKKCLHVFDEKGRFSPVYDEADVSFIETPSIILATGQRVDLDFLGDHFKDEIQSVRGLIEVGEHNDTRHAGVYAGGDVATGPSLAIQAVRAGGNAARNMTKYMGMPMVLEIEKEAFLTFDPEGVKLVKASQLVDTPVEKRCLDVEDSSSLTEMEAAVEASRCMNCGCYSSNASDMANMLLALDVTVETTVRTLSGVEFFSDKLRPEYKLERGELVKAIHIPSRDGWKSDYAKFRLRKAIDFALVAVASDIKVVDGTIEDIRLVFGGVAPVPFRASAVEEVLKGQVPSKELALKASEVAVENVMVMRDNGYKVESLRTMVRDFVETLI
ncbi:FAD-dependent oxidoreductase [Tannockella kyphosi]|uniref:FAD-dependent oxidoreductase n=1 Tax=Tannockella kyphosi TaxID=2899121 RepID=UPI002011DA2C|nr:FAD-dependent oxidoreductase [Tannockella kyphosi]